ncbi:MAG: hypothetical protein JXA20_12635 [Spirochaetes bacterium]|nr:hypothetical protein [Spirochaetota bacterium]
MNGRTLYRILSGVAAIFMTAAFNQILIVNATLYTAENILLACIMALLIYQLVRDDSETVSFHEYCSLLLTLLAGTSFQSRSKLFLFLCLLGIVQLASGLRTKDRIILSKNTLMLIASIVVSISAFIGIKFNLFPLWAVFSVTVLYLALLIVRLRLKSM